MAKAGFVAVVNDSSMEKSFRSRGKKYVLAPRAVSLIPVSAFLALRRQLPALGVLRRGAAALLCALLFGGSLFAQTQVKVVNETARLTIMSGFDLDGEAADADQIVAGPDALADSTTYTIDAQPDSCRLIDITVVDGDSSLTAGGLTVTGTDCLGYARVCTYTFAAGGSGVKTLTRSSGGPSGAGCYLASVTSVVTGVLTGEGGADTLTVGYTSNSVSGWGMYGRLKPIGPNGEHGVDPFGSLGDPQKLITTAGVSTTTLTAVGGNDAFASVVAGDLLSFSVNGEPYQVKVATWTSADEVVVSKAVTIPAGGVQFRFQHFYFSTDPYDQLWVSVDGWKTAMFTWSIDANANTGGVVSSLQCSSGNAPDFPTGGWVEVGPGETDPDPTADNRVTTASGSTQAPYSKTIALNYGPFSYCRFGNSFGTGDDADAAPESINVSVQLSK
jgi:hypothetical protein